MYEIELLKNKASIISLEYEKSKYYLETNFN